MKEKIILLIVALLLPILSTANEVVTTIKSKSDLTKLESMDIKTLIEKAKLVSSEDRTKIENLIKKKIAKAHRENYING